MCLILLKPQNIKLPKLLFKNVFQRNRDGFGWMYLNNEKEIVTHNTISENWEEHYQDYLPHEDNMICLHWRMKTQGDKCLENTHPFLLQNNKLALMHNGSIHGYNTKQKESDTNQFVNDTLNPFLNHIKDTTKFLEDPKSEEIFSHIIGKHNKLMLLTNEKFYPINEFYITNEQYIPEMQGLIFSNNYAWDNQFWYKTAQQNEINYEYIKTPKVISLPKHSYKNNSYYQNKTSHRHWQQQKELTRSPEPKTNHTDKQKLNRIESKTIHLVKKDEQSENCSLVIPNPTLMLQ